MQLRLYARSLQYYSVTKMGQFWLLRIRNILVYWTASFQRYMPAYQYLIPHASSCQMFFQPSDPGSASDVQSYWHKWLSLSFVEASVPHPPSSALEGTDAKWHEALKQHEPFSSLQFLLVFLHSLSQKNQTLKEDSCQHDTVKVNKNNAWNI